MYDTIKERPGRTAVSTDVAVIMLIKAFMSAVKGRAYDIGHFFLPVFKIKKT